MTTDQNRPLPAPSPAACTPADARPLAPGRAPPKPASSTSSPAEWPSPSANPPSRTRPETVTSAPTRTPNPTQTTGRRRSTAKVTPTTTAAPTQAMIPEPTSMRPASPAAECLPLLKLRLTAGRTACYVRSDGTAPTACTIEGCGRLPRIQYVDRHTSALSAICCLHCCYNARNADGDKVHTPECDALQLIRDNVAEATAAEPTPGAHRTKRPQLRHMARALVVGFPTPRCGPLPGAEPTPDRHRKGHYIQVPRGDGRRRHAHGRR